MAVPRKRRMPDIGENYKGKDPHLAGILDKLQLAIKHIIDDDFITEKDIYCKDLITAEQSIYIGPKVYNNKLENLKHELYWNQKKITGSTGGSLTDHASDHESGGVDPVNHDSLDGFLPTEHLPTLDEDDLNSDSAVHVATQQSIKAYVDNATVITRQSLDAYDAEPARGSESNIHGGILKLADAQALGPATPANDVSVDKGIGKLMVVVNAGSDLAGTFTVTGTSVDRATGATTPADSEVITVDAVTTDTSDQDTNTNDRHAFSGAYITSKWFVGTVVLSTDTLNLSDVDVYHVSFEQFGDTPNITLDQLDINLFTTNVNAEFDAYLYALVVSGSKCTITREASVNVGADGIAALANKYERLKRAGIAKSLDGSSDGIWLDVHYDTPAYVEDVTIRVWYLSTYSLTT